MPKLLLTCLSLLAFLFGFQTEAQAQKFALKLNPLSGFVSTVNIQAEYAFHPRMSVQLGLYAGKGTMGAFFAGADSDVDYTWYGLTPEFRYYILPRRKVAPEGLYIAPYFRFAHERHRLRSGAYGPDYDSYAVREVGNELSILGFGNTFGYQLILWDRVALDFFFGWQHRSLQSSDAVDCYNCEAGDILQEPRYDGMIYKGLGIRTGFSVGVVF